jgi:hypothetical protein
MASILDGLKEAVIEVIRPGTRQALGERAALKQMYTASNTNMTPNTWYRLHNSAGACVGFSYSCNCMVEYQLLSAFEWMRDYSCGQCKAKFDLLRHAGIKDAKGEFKVKPEEWESLLAALPVRPRLAGVPERPRVIDTWENSRAGEAEYEPFNGSFGVGFGGAGK